MKFGKVDHPGELDLSLPRDGAITKEILNKKGQKTKNVSVGCAKWNRADLKGFYPRGTKDELGYYSTQFNAIELNATFYRIFAPSVVEGWYNKTPNHFKFYPKIPQVISQFKRLKNCDNELAEYLDSIAYLQEKLGMVFLQMHPFFSYKDFHSLQSFIEQWPQGIPLAVEVRHKDWYEDKVVNNELLSLLKQYNITHIITDTAGRRDLVHMQLTTPKTFIRYTGANHESDYTRLDDWLKRIKKWSDAGLEDLNFFVHQNVEKESPLLSAYFIEKLNKTFDLSIHVPQTL